MLSKYVVFRSKTLSRISCASKRNKYRFCVIFSTLLFIFDRVGGEFGVEVYRFNQIVKSSATDFQGQKNIHESLIYFFAINYILSM